MIDPRYFAKAVKQAEQTRNIEKIMPLILFSLFFVFGCSRTTTVKGTVLDENGHPSEYAVVGTASSDWARPDTFIACVKDGSYSVDLLKQGIEYVVFSIPNHDPMRIPILNDEHKEITLDVKLAAYEYKEQFDEVSIRTEGVPLPESLTRLEDGTFRYEKKTDKDQFQYQLDIQKLGRLVNDPDAQPFVPDRIGDYWSVVKPANGMVRILFDPGKLPRKKSAQSFTLVGSDFDRKFSSILSQHDSIMHDNASSRGAYYLKHAKFEGFEYEEGSFFTDFVKKTETEQDPRLAKLMKLMYLTSYKGGFKTLDADKTKEFFHDVPPEDSAWCYFPDAIYVIDRLYPQADPRIVFDESRQKTQMAEYDEFLEKTKSEEIMTAILTRKVIMAKNYGSIEELRKLHALIASEYKDVKELQDLLRKYPAESKMNIGSEIPDFEVVSLDNPKEKFTKQSMLGKVYLIDFWFTTCVPCIDEMDNLHKAYAKYKDRGFDILSLSVDDEQLVDPFRKKKWSMPWKNSVIVKNPRILRDFEVSSFPYPILVGADGKLLETDRAALRGERLKQTLARFLRIAPN
jgi:thiol-disulfide isomerase/thioredoxin